MTTNDWQSQTEASTGNSLDDLLAHGSIETAEPQVKGPLSSPFDGDHAPYEQLYRVPIDGLPFFAQPNFEGRTALIINGSGAAVMVATEVGDAFTTAAGAMTQLRLPAFRTIVAKTASATTGTVLLFIFEDVRDPFGELAGSGGGGTIPALGQALMAASLPVVIASNQSTIPVSIAAALAITAAALPLPANAAQETGGNLAAILAAMASLGARNNVASAAAFLDALTIMIGNAAAPAITEGQFSQSSADLFSNLRTRTLEPFFAVAAPTMTRPANTTAYVAGRPLSNNTVAASVVALAFALSSQNNWPVTLERCRLLTTDTGPVAGTTQIRLWLFNSDPTASSGVGQGDNGAAFANKQAGLIGTMIGTFYPAGISDGAGMTLIPESGQRIITAPSSGGKTIYGLMQILTAFTPLSASTWTLSMEGFQGVTQ